jgi:hypothetical protein
MRVVARLFCDPVKQVRTEQGTGTRPKTRVKDDAQYPACSVKRGLLFDGKKRSFANKKPRCSKSAA